MSLSHGYSGDHERLATAAVASFNALLPVGAAVMLLPEPVPAPVRTMIEGPAFVQGSEILVKVMDSDQPVNIKRIREGWKV